MDMFAVLLGASALFVIVILLIFFFGTAAGVANGISLVPLAILLLGIAIGVIYMDSLLPGISNTANPILQLVYEGKNIAIMITVVGLLIVAIRSLLLSTNLPESTRGMPHYEPFAISDSSTSNLKLIQKAQSLLDSIESAVDNLDTLEQEACEMVSDSRQQYLDANMAPGSEMDAYNDCIVREGEGGEEACKNLKPTPERQATLEKRRKERAQQKYQLEFSQFQNAKPGSLLECFVGQESENESEMEIEEELQAAIQDLEPFVAEAFQKRIRDRCLNLRTSVSFVLHLTSKGQAALQKAQAEGFVNQIQAAQPQPLTIQQKAQQSIQSVQSLLSEIQETQTLFQKAKQEYQTLTGKLNRMASGAPTQQDLLTAMSPAPVQGDCPKFMFAYATDAGGSCCPVEPTEYDTGRGQYLKCGPATSETQKVAQKRRNQAMGSCQDDNCIRATLAAFQNAQQFPQGCRSGLNPLEEMGPACSYVCSTGAVCPYSEFRGESTNPLPQ